MFDFEQLDMIPRSSGVYYFYDNHGVLLYVGLAKNLRSRLSSHKHINHMARKAKFLSSMMRLVIDEKAKQSLNEIWVYFSYQARCMFTPVVVDYVLPRVKRIEIEEMEYDKAWLRERDQIHKLRPIFNSQTGSKEYYNVRDDPDYE